MKIIKQFLYTFLFLLLCLYCIYSLLLFEVNPVSWGKKCIEAFLMEGIAGCAFMSIMIIAVLRSKE